MSRILVVDDKPQNRSFLTTLLGYYGHTVFEAADGAEGLSVASCERPDLIISDVLMPTMDGYEFVRRLRQDANLATKPVVFYTAHYLEREALSLAAKCGVSLVLRKPCEPAEVLSVVESALGLVSTHLELPEEVAHEHLELLTTRLSKTAEELGLANLRLEALIDAGQELARELHPHKLIDQYASVARQIIGADRSVIGISDDSGLEWSDFASSGLSEEAVLKMRTRWKPDVAGSDLDLGVQGQLGVAIRTPQRCFGWLWVAGKLGGGAFSEDDDSLARTLAAQLAVAYENARLYESVERHAADLEHRVSERTRELEATKHELEAFTFAVSHELRTHLHHLTGFSTLLEERCGQTLSADACGLVRRLRQTSCDMADLVQSLSELSRISKQEIRLEPVSLSTVLEEAIQAIDSASGDRAIEWRIHPLPEVKGGRTLLKQVFVNLLSNAVKFTKCRQNAVIEVGEDVSQDGAPVIYVRDNGAGFDPRDADRLFGAFQRLHRQSEYPGTGLGLTIVQRIVNRHAGRIWAESVLAQGTTFYFTIGVQTP